MAKGVIPDTHSLALGAIGLQTPDYVNLGFEEADVVIAAGYDIVEYAPHSWNPKRDKKIVHVDLSPAEVDAAYIVNVGVVGDIASSLDSLATLAHAFRRARLEISENAARRTGTGPPDTPSHLPQRILADFRRSGRRRHRHFDVAPTSCGWHASSHAATEHPHHLEWLCGNGHGRAGPCGSVGIPGIAAWWRLRVTAVSMNSQELETAARLETPFVALCLTTAPTA
jgi:acetolactate synthase-1/2/3 large subunit